MRLWQTAAAEGRPNQIVNVEESFAGPSVGEVLTLAFSHGGSALPRWPRCSQRTGSGPSKLQNCKWKNRNFAHSTVLVLRMAHRNWKETKQQPSMLPGPAVPGCCLARLRRIARCIATNQKIRPILDLYLYRVSCSVSDTMQYQGGPAGFSL